MSDFKKNIEERDEEFLERTTQLFYQMSDVLEGVVQYLKVTDPSLVRWTHVDLYGDTVHIIGTLDDQSEYEMFSDDMMGEQKILNVKLPLDLVNQNETSKTIEYLKEVERQYEASDRYSTDDSTSDIDDYEELLNNLDKKVLH